MKSKYLLTLTALAAFAFPAFAEDDTPLGKAMEKLGPVTKKAAIPSLQDPAKKDENLAKIAKARAAAEEGVKYEPALTADIPAADKAKFLADYKAAMESLVKGFDDLKAAVEKGDNAAIEATVTKLDGMKKEGHKKFKKKD